jgi:hypothetical protein
MDASLTATADFFEPTFRRTAVIWWALVWRGVILGLGAGFLFGFIEGIIGAWVGVSPSFIRYFALISGLIVGIPVGIYVVQLALRKKYREFTVRLVPTETGQSN